RKMAKKGINSLNLINSYESKIMNVKLSTVEAALNTPLKPLELNSEVKCPKCKSRNLICSVRYQTADVIHFENGCFQLKESEASKIFKKIDLECKDCGNKFENEKVKTPNEVLF
ncbi:TPA: hypothetical protein ACGC0O_003711, partial [Acinetobacter baumannii]